VTMGGVCCSAVLLGGTFMGLTALGLMAARRMSGPRSQSAIGLMTVSFASGQMIGPMIAGVLSDRLGGLRIPSLAAAIALLAAAVLAIASARANAAQSIAGQ
jgi:predicted MFS family arabinose efflux permease